MALKDGEIQDETPKTNVTMDIRNMVKEGLVNAHVAVKQAIIDAEVSKEVARRITAAEIVVGKIESLEAEGKKIRPTPAGFNATGVAVGEAVYTQEQVKAIRENKEKMAKLESALEKALVNGDFSKVFELGTK